MKASDIIDLRSALTFLSGVPGQLVTTDTEVDPYLELAGVYRRVGAGTPTTPPTKIGPAMIFNRVKGCEMPVAVGVLASRERTAMLLGTSKEKLVLSLLSALENPVPPVRIESDAKAPCQEVVLKPPFDIRRFLPAVMSTEKDAGVFVNMGIVRAIDPENGETDVTFHRICLHGPDTMTIQFSPGRHIECFRLKAEAMGRPLPASINIGLDPAVQVATSFEAPTTPLGFDELTIAGALRQRPVELVDCVSQPAEALSRAEIVIEGEFRPGEYASEDAISGTGWAMPEFPGYEGRARSHQPVFHVTAITHRADPIYQMLIGPGEEHVTLAGIPTEASIYRLVHDAMPGFVQNVYSHSAGGGKFLAVLQVKKRGPMDEGRQRQAAICALAAFSELKHVILVDEDVDLYDTNDVMWAMTTRYQADVDTVCMPGTRFHRGDPTTTSEYNPMLREQGISCKAVFDCTVPFHLKEAFERPRFADVDLSRFLNP